MKKIIILLVSLLLTGCAQNGINDNTDNDDEDIEPYCVINYGQLIKNALH